MQVNDKQIGGDHYKKGGYQHWDFVTDTDMNYLQGCATKYISRWRKKNGMQDLEKAKHYVEKLKESKSKVLLGDYSKNLTNFGVANELTPKESKIIGLILARDFEDAIYFVNCLIQEADQILEAQNPVKKETISVSSEDIGDGADILGTEEA